MITDLRLASRWPQALRLPGTTTREFRDKSKSKASHAGVFWAALGSGVACLAPCRIWQAHQMGAAAGVLGGRDWLWLKSFSKQYPSHFLFLFLSLMWLPVSQQLVHAVLSVS